MKYVYKFFFVISILGVLSIFFISVFHVCSMDRFSKSNYYLKSPASHFFAKNQNEFSVAVLSDTGAENHVLEQVIDDIRKSDENYSFMLYLGDFITHTSSLGQYWLLDEIKKHVGNMPLYAVPGNHDVFKKHKYDVRPYRNVMGNTYYWFSYGNVLFIALDNSSRNIDDEQFEWLEDTLKKIRPMFNNCVIYSHIPPIITKSISNDKLDVLTKNKLENVLKKYKVDVMLFGHVHYFKKNNFAGVPFYTTPSSGQVIRDENIKKYGYISLSFDKKGVKKVEPKYIDFKNDNKREQIEYWYARDILGFSVYHVIRYLFFVTLFTTFIGSIFYVLNKRK